MTNATTTIVIIVTTTARTVTMTTAITAATDAKINFFAPRSREVMRTDCDKECAMPATVAVTTQDTTPVSTAMVVTGTTEEYSKRSKQASNAVTRKA